MRSNVLAMGVSSSSPYGSPALSPTFKLLASVQNSSHVVRYNLQPVFFKQNIAEHMGRCCMLASLICAELNLLQRETAEVLTKISLHDLHETITGEVVHPTKHHPFFSDIFLKFETEAENQLFMQQPDPGRFQEILVLLHSQSPTFDMVNYLCNIIDLAELVMYCTTEVQMGNNHVAYMLSDTVESLSIMSDEFYHSFHLNIRGGTSVIWGIITSARLTLGRSNNSMDEEYHEG